MNDAPRVALFCETFHEINGVALTARQLVAFARRNNLPFLSVRPGPWLRHFQDASTSCLELPRSFASFGIERDLRYDLFFWRHLRYLRQALRKFQPDVIHVTSPGEFGQMGAWLAHSLGVPLVASWHTNLHQFAGSRLRKLLSFLPAEISTKSQHWAERASLRLLLRFYRIARATLAPTPEQVRWLQEATQKPSFLMPRGVDCEEFHPRYRSVHDDTLRLGFVGRVTPEKSVRLLADVERALFTAGFRNFQIVIVGDGSERAWLESNLHRGDFRGVLRGPALTRAYADMDLFLFPSRTDTFGNVIQEAAASGVPSIVTSEGGPRNLVVHGVTGFIADDDRQFIDYVLELVRQPELLRRMARNARENVLGASWDAAFEMTYAAYRYCKQTQIAPAPYRRPRFPAMPSVPAA